MRDEADLHGYKVLVVEDDYYLATDAARALRSAGAEVMGPFPTEESAWAELEAQRPDAVVVDINLGWGPSFKFAEVLKDRGIPFVFVTGYDQETIPEQFNDIERVEKPAQLKRIVGAISKLVV
jgi:two-component SAPR family response regulator